MCNCIMENKFYSPEDAAGILGISVNRLYYLRKIGLLSMEKRERRPLSLAKVWKILHSELVRMQEELKKG